MLLSVAITDMINFLAQKNHEELLFKVNSIGNIVTIVGAILYLGGYGYLMLQQA